MVMSDEILTVEFHENSVGKLRLTVPSHAWLTGYTGGNEYYLSALEAFANPGRIGGISLDLHSHHVSNSPAPPLDMKTSYGAPCVNMRDIGRNTRSADDIVEGEVADARVKLQEEGEGLSDSSCRAEDCDFGGLSIRQIVFG